MTNALGWLAAGLAAGALTTHAFNLWRERFRPGLAPSSSCHAPPFACVCVRARAARAARAAVQPDTEH